MQTIFLQFFEEGTVNDQRCQKGFAKFRSADFSLNDDLKSGKPVEVDSNQDITGK